MCRRYITPDQATLEREWATLPRDVEYFPSYNFAPTLRGPVAIERDGERKVVLMTWVFQPHWAKRSWINARAETVFDALAFAKHATRDRCLVMPRMDRGQGAAVAAPVLPPETRQRR